MAITREAMAALHNQVYSILNSAGVGFVLTSVDLSIDGGENIYMSGNFSSRELALCVIDRSRDFISDGPLNLTKNWGEYEM